MNGRRGICWRLLDADFRDRISAVFAFAIIMQLLLYIVAIIGLRQGDCSLRCNNVGEIACKAKEFCLAEEDSSNYTGG